MTKFLLAVLLCGQAAFGAKPTAISDAARLFDSVKKNILRSAESLPAENYGFTPVPEVMSWAQMLAHVADTQIRVCTRIRSSKLQPNISEKLKSRNPVTKDSLLEDVKASFAVCEAALESLTEESAAKTIDLGNQSTTRIGAINFVISHNSEHYGNLVTYMRLMGLVPPSTAPQRN